MLNEEDFDPYEILIGLQHSVIEIARAHNGKAQELDAAYQQIATLNRQLKHLANRVQRLETLNEVKPTTTNNSQ